MGNIVLVWAGGTGMSWVAGILHELGFSNIVCIDSSQSQLTDNLQERWLKVIIGHGLYQPKSDDVLIYSEAAAQSPEVIAARNLISQDQKMMLIMNYFQFLGEISKYFITAGITGTNGKSSTTALAIYGARKQQTFWLGILGALVPDFNTQSYLINHAHLTEIKDIFKKILTGKSDHPIVPKQLVFIVEACEYKRHFLHLDLDYAAITSIEYDHADYYPTFDDYKHAFKEMLTKIKGNCFVIKWFLQKYPEFNTYSLQEISEKSYNFSTIFWPHTNKNATLTQDLLSQLFGQENFDILDFKWLWRRLEYIGSTKAGAKVFSDYGHMASSLASGYEALKQKFPDKQILLIFQPHQITRIFTGWDDFVQSSKEYDQVYIYNIYAARENISQFDFSKRGENIHDIAELGQVFAKACRGEYKEHRQDIETILHNADKNQVVAIFSAWDIDYQVRALFQRP
jgi:UDP-N-acetylmuramate--alanine ligase